MPCVRIKQGNFVNLHPATGHLRQTRSMFWPALDKNPQIAQFPSLLDPVSGQNDLSERSKIPSGVHRDAHITALIIWAWALFQVPLLFLSFLDSMRSLYITVHFSAIFSIIFKGRYLFLLFILRFIIFCIPCHPGRFCSNLVSVLHAVRYPVTYILIRESQLSPFSSFFILLPMGRFPSSFS